MKKLKFLTAMFACVAILGSLGIVSCSNDDDEDEAPKVTAVGTYETVTFDGAVQNGWSVTVYSDGTYEAKNGEKVLSKGTYVFEESSTTKGTITETQVLEEGVFVASTKQYTFEITGESAVTLTTKVATPADPPAEKVTITYSTDHGTAPSQVEVEKGSTLTDTQLAAITAEGFTFGGWYIGDVAATTATVVNENITLTAKWTQNQTEG